MEENNPMELLLAYAHLKTEYFALFRGWLEQAKAAGVPFMYALAIQKDAISQSEILWGMHTLDYFADMFVKENPSDCGL